MDKTLDLFIEDIQDVIRGMSMLPAHGQIRGVLRGMTSGCIPWNMSLMLALLADSPLHQLEPFVRLAKVNAALALYAVKVAPSYRQPQRRII
jgi:hypothetical protein